MVSFLRGFDELSVMSFLAFWERRARMLKDAVTAQHIHM